MDEGNWVLLIASEVGGTDSVSDRAMGRLVDAISKEGYEVVRTATPEDGLSLVKSDPSHSAILLDWDLEVIVSAQPNHAGANGGHARLA